MAKGKATGLWKGKVGNNVFYKITNSNNAQKQGIRERVIEVLNPKTYYQANQRMKLLPAQRIAGALKEIVERGQQGVKYGALSRNEFLSRALSMKTGFPFMEKSNPNIIPGEYQITKGTLPEVLLSYDADRSNFCSSLVLTNDFDNMGELSGGLLDNNGFLQEGDQITGVAFSVKNGVILYGYASFILDRESEVSIPVFADCSFSISRLEGETGALCIAPDNSMIIASAIIISRANGANGYLRSNATLAVDKTNNAIAKYFTTTGRSDAIKTYEGDTSVTNNTNWPVDVDGDGGTSGGGGSAATRGLYTLTAADLKSSSSAAAGKKILVGFENDLPTVVYYTKDENDDNMLHWFCCDLNGEHVTYGDPSEPDTILLGSLADSFYQSLRKVEYA